MKYIKNVFLSTVVFFSSVSSIYSEETKFVKELREKIKVIFQEYEDLFFKKVIVKPDNDKDKDHKKEDCDCGGDGLITHGDGHTTPCPCEVCNCKKKSGDVKPSVLMSKPTIIMLSRKSCPPCKLWKDQKMQPLKDAGWDVEVLELDTEDGSRRAKLLGLSTEMTPKFYVTLRNKKYVKQGSLQYSDLEKYNKDALAK